MDNTKMAECQNLLDEHRCTFTYEHRYSGNSQHLRSIKSRSEDLPQKKILQLPILTPPVIFTFKWNFLFQMHKVPSRIWLKMPQKLKVDARRPETKVESSVYAPYLPWDGKDKVTGLHAPYRKSSEQAERTSPAALDSLVTCNCPGKPILLGQFTFLSVRKSSKIIAKGTIL